MLLLLLLRFLLFLREFLFSFRFWSPLFLLLLLLLGIKEVGFGEKGVLFGIKRLCVGGWDINRGVSVI